MSHSSIRSILLCVGAAMLAISLWLSTPTSALAQARVLSLATQYPDGTAVTTAAKDFADRVNRQLDKIVEVRIDDKRFPLASDEIVDDLSNGKHALAILSTVQMTKLNSAFEIYDLPWLFVNIDEVSMIQQSVIGQMLLGSLVDSPIRALAYWNIGFSRIFSKTSDDIKRPADLQKLRLGAWVSDNAKPVWSSLDISVQPLGIAASAFPGNGVDAVDAPLAFVTTKALPLQKARIGGEGVRPMSAVLAVNAKTWDDLGFEARQTLQQIAAEVGIEGDQKAAKREADDEAVLRDRGFDVQSFDAARFEAFSAAAAPGWQEASFSREGGLLDGVKSAIEEIRHPSTRPPEPPQPIQRLIDAAPAGRPIKIPFVTDRCDKREGNEISLGDTRCKVLFGIAEVSLSTLSKKAKNIIDFEVNLNASFSLVANVDEAIKSIDSSKTMSIYIHGCCNSFIDSVKRTALLALDLKRIDQMVLFAWPSGSTKISFLSFYAYGQDRKLVNSNILLPDLVEGLASLSARVGSPPDIVAHSLGARAFVRAFGPSPPFVTSGDQAAFGRVVLAAGDEIHPSFFANYPGTRNAQSTTIYAQRSDFALSMARSTKTEDEAEKGPRLGQAADELIDLDPSKADVIDASPVVDMCSILDTNCNHSYFVTNERVARDLASSISGETATGSSRNLPVVGASGARKFQHFLINP